MRYGFVIPAGDIKTIVALTREAEAAGWDAVFTWDGMYTGPTSPVYDPWVVLAAMAAATERVRIGAMLTPPSRRRPWKLARETVSVDHLSGGRLILPVGLGAVDTFGPFGEETDRVVRARLLDESLEILTGLWSGQPLRYEGEHYRFPEVTFLPPPVQSPRIPIWVVGAWPRQRSMARTLRYDGLLPNKLEADGSHGEVTPADVRAMADYVRERRTAPGPFEIVVEGRTPGDDSAVADAVVRPFADAGATWWVEVMWTEPNESADIRARIEQGPPRLV